jgi:hypothetical protein
VSSEKLPSNPYHDASQATLAAECARMARELEGPARTAEERIARRQRVSLLLSVVAERLAPRPNGHYVSRHELEHDPNDFVDSYLESHIELTRQNRYRILVKAAIAALGPARAQDWIRDSRVGDPRGKTYEMAQDSDDGLRRVLVHLAALRT